MSHLFNPANPTLLIQTGLQYFVGRAGLCTQLSPIFAGQGTGVAPNVPGQPNIGGGGSPYTPIFPPFPPATNPGLKTFTITRGAGAVRLFYKSGGVGFSSPCGASLAYGTLVSGGGTNGASLLCILANTNFGLVLQLPSPASNAFASNPFTISTWNSITFTTSGTDTPANTVFTINSSSLSFAATGTQAGGYNAQWGPTSLVLPTAYTASETLVFTVA